MSADPDTWDAVARALADDIAALLRGPDQRQDDEADGRAHDQPIRPTSGLR